MGDGSQEVHLGLKDLTLLLHLRLGLGLPLDEESYAEDCHQEKDNVQQNGNRAEKQRRLDSQVHNRLLALLAGKRNGLESEFPSSRRDVIDREAAVLNLGPFPQTVYFPKDVRSGEEGIVQQRHADLERTSLAAEQHRNRAKEAAPFRLSG